MYLKGRLNKVHTRCFTRLLLPFSLLTALTACGGGSGDGENPPSSVTNSPPTAVNQTYSVNRAATLSVNEPGVLENSTDPENDDLSAQVVSDPTHGSLTLNSDGSFSYVHDGNSSEDDSFTYKASDGENDSNLATVTIDVNN